MSSRRTAARWRAQPHPGPPDVEVLIPTAGRDAELAVTLAGLAAQDDPPFAVIVSDQSGRSGPVPVVLAMLRVLAAQGRPVRWIDHAPPRGMAEQRQFLLDQSSADEVLYLDDDVWLEPGAVATLHQALGRLGCGFVGMAVQGLSYLDDERPDEQESFERWEGPVRPERMSRDAPGFARWRLHNAANLVHLAGDVGIADDEWVPYRVAWIGGCVLYRRDRLVAAGGFGFWPLLPPDHAGEDVAAQWAVMLRDGGAGVIPSGAVHLETPTTVRVRDVDAIDVVDPEGGLWPIAPGDASGVTPTA